MGSAVSGLGLGFGVETFRCPKGSQVGLRYGFRLDFKALGFGGGGGCRGFAVRAWQ